MKKSREKAMKEIREGLKETQKEIDGLDLSSIINESLKAVELALEKVDLQEIVNESLKEVNKSIKEIDREQIRKELLEIRREFKKSFPSYRESNEEENKRIFKNKKIKIKKKVLLKVPKGVTLDLNTRHCKLKLSKMSALGKVSYGSFEANGIDGGDLNIHYAPVQIRTLENTKLYLNNVTDAKLASVTQSSLCSDSGKLEISELFSGTTIEASFGDVKIKKVNPNLKDFSMILNQADATMNLKGYQQKLRWSSVKTIVRDDLIKHDGKGITFLGTFDVNSNNDQLKINGKYSELTIKQ